MPIRFSKVKTKGQIVIPVDIRRKLEIEVGTRIAFLEDSGRIFIQPVTDEFIASMKGLLAEQDLPDQVQKSKDRDIR